MFFCYNLYGDIMQRYFAQNKNEKNFIMNENDLYHMKVVMRMKNGQKIEVVYDEEIYICKYDNNNIEIIEKLQNNTTKLPELILVIPLLTEAKMDYILQKSTELGVDTIIPVRMERSKVVVDSKKEIKKIERWLKICKEASEQSKRHNIPKIEKICDFKNLNDLEGTKIVCSTTSNFLIKNFLTNNQNYDKIIIVIGPEGGLSNKEEKYLNDIGFVSVSFGKRILRVETVPLYILSIINYELME